MNGDAVVCPTCGAEFLPHRTRTRCRRCGYRIPIQATVCPKCGAQRVGLVFAIRRGATALMGLLLLVCLGWVVLRAITTNALPRFLGLVEPERSPTPAVIYVVATQALPLPTLLLPPTVEPTVQPSPTPTRRGAPTATPTRRGAPTPTALAPSSIPVILTPTPATYPAPQPLAPLNASIFKGADAKIILEWQPATRAGLSESEWYMISIQYTGRDGKPAERIGWSREARWTVGQEWWNEASPTARTFQWQVTVTRIEGVDPYASPSRVPISPPSPARTFIWN